jgi:hypothetical protein
MWTVSQAEVKDKRVGINSDSSPVESNKSVSKAELT